MSEELVRFIERFVLKSGEKIAEMTESDGLYDVTIVRHSPRVYRETAKIRIAATLDMADFEQRGEELIPAAFEKYKWSNYAKRQIEEPADVVYDWLQRGLMMREIRFQADGISVKENHFRIGPVYFQLKEAAKKQANETFSAALNEFMKKMRSLEMPEEFFKAAEMSTLPKNWGKQKRLDFLRFCIAFYDLSRQKDVFDFKEIGAVYEPGIGGSKIFDTHGDDFLERLKAFQIAPEDYGLVSAGRIVPIYFTGNASSEIVKYELGAVHAMTDHTVLSQKFTTINRVLWLVENRAILTRMALEVDFLRETNSFIICLDGQIKSAHKRLIKQLVGSGIKQALVWTDYDAAGVTIATHAMDLLDCPAKIIGRDGNLFDEVAAYKADFLEKGEHEQEQQLGDVTAWKSWI